MPPTGAASGPLILLSPAKTLNFESSLSPALRAAQLATPRFAQKTGLLANTLAGLSQARLKSLMGISDSLAALNHARFQAFDDQPPRSALGAFEGAAYKGLDAPTLSAESLQYCQRSLRILCGLYGILQPCDQIRPYRLEMSNKLACPDGSPDLYKFWGSEITASLNDELREMPDGPSKFVLNVASQEYAKAVDFNALDAPLVITAVFPGPAVYAKQARGEMVRYCAEQRVTSPEALRGFCGSNGLWSYVASASDDTTYVFHRGAGKSASASGAGRAKAPASAGRGKKRAAETEVRSSTKRRT